MTNTEYLYNAMKRFTDARAAAREAYLQTMKKYESAKGSPFYTEQKDKAMKVRNDAVEAAKAECVKTVNSALNLMRNTSGKRPMRAPTEEQLRILQLLKMRKTVTPHELEAAANAMDGNGSALAVLNEIAHEQNHTPRNYTAMATDGLPAAAADDAINNLSKACTGILASGVNHAARLAAEHNARINGVKVDPDDLPQEQPYQGEKDFYSRAMPWTPYEVFAKAVND